MMPKGENIALSSFFQSICFYRTFGCSYHSVKNHLKPGLSTGHHSVAECLVLIKLGTLNLWCMTLICLGEDEKERDKVMISIFYIILSERFEKIPEKIIECSILSNLQEERPISQLMDPNLFQGIKSLLKPPQITHLSK